MLVFAVKTFSNNCSFFYQSSHSGCILSSNLQTKMKTTACVLLNKSQLRWRVEWNSTPKNSAHSCTWPKLLEFFFCERKNTNPRIKSSNLNVHKIIWLKVTDFVYTFCLIIKTVFGAENENENKESDISSHRENVTVSACDFH